MDDPYRPVALRVMAEWMEQDPVWDSHPDHVGPVELTDLGVSGELVERLRAWNARFNDRARSDYSGSTTSNGRPGRPTGCAWPTSCRTSCPTSRSATGTTVTSGLCGSVAVLEATARPAGRVTIHAVVQTRLHEPAPTRPWR